MTLYFQFSREATFSEPYDLLWSPICTALQSLKQLRVLALEPWLGGSHQRFLEAWSQNSTHHIQVLGLPARHWRWRMAAGAWALAERIQGTGLPRPDVLFVSDYVDLARLYGHLPPAWRKLPAVLYFHENQLTYPQGPERAGQSFADDLAPAWANILSCLAADRVLFNSKYHREDFAQAADQLIARLPKPRPRAQLREALAQASVVPPGIEFQARDLGNGGEPGSPLRIAFNHRWEHDKDPAGFLAAVQAALASGAKLELVLLGERYPRTPPEVEGLLQELQPVIRHSGHAASRSEYVHLLGSCDLVVSTAQHEFYGMALLEGLALGVQPLAPKRLSYPEVLPVELHSSALYTSPEGLIESLVGAANKPNSYRLPAKRAALSALAQPHNAVLCAKKLDRAVVQAATPASV